MNVPFKIVLPSFKIDNQTRDVSISFSTMPIAGEERVATIIDYWLITDHRGKTMRDIPKGKNGYIAQNQHGKKIELVMRGAGFNLSYDSLDVCIHFLLRNGQSVSANYKYKMIGNKFAFSSIDAKKMTAEEQDVMLERLVAADSFDKEATAKKISPTDNTNESNFDNNSFVGYNDEITRFMRAVYKEMYFLKNDGGRKYDITNGCFIMQLQGAFVYIFDLDAELYLADDSPVTVTVGLEKIAGTVLFCENFQIMVALDQIPHLDKTTKIASAKINAEPWKLLEKLNDCLRKININNEIALSLLEDGPYLATNGDEASIVRGQEKAYNQAINSPITVIWGPPGTGKTYTMAKIAAEFLRQGKKVLIVSHSNVSVDNVAKQIYNQVKVLI